MKFKNRFLKHVTILASGATLGQLAVLIVSPVVSRLYDPGDFGIFGVYISLVGFIAVFANFRFELAIPLQETESDAAFLTVLCILMATFTSGLSMAIALPLSPLLERELGVEFRFPFVASIAVGIFLFATYNTLSFLAIASQRFGRIAKSKLIYGVIAASIQLAAFKFASYGLILSDLVGRSISGGYLATALEVIQSNRCKITLSRATKLISKYRRFPLLSAPATVFNSAGVHAPAIIVASMFGISSAGAYIFTTRVVGAPTGLIGQAVGKVFIGELSDQIRNDKQLGTEIFNRTVIGLAAVGLVPFLILLIFGVPIFEFVFGSQWSIAGKIASYIAPMLYLQFITVPVSQSLNLMGHQSLQLAWDIFRVLTVIIVFFVSHAFGMSLIQTMMLLSTTAVISYCILLALIWSKSR